MVEEKLKIHRIKCHACDLYLEEQERCGLRLPQSLKACCERKAMEADWKNIVQAACDYWLCPRCQRKEEEAQRHQGRYILLLGVVLGLFIASLSTFFVFLCAEDAEERRAWEGFFMERIAQLSQDEKDALHWLATNFNVSGDRWRQEYPHVDVCVLSEKTSAMECNPRLDTWTIRKHSRKTVLKVIKKRS